jgi:hypothetical protein
LFSYRNRSKERRKGGKEEEEEKNTSEQSETNLDKLQEEIFRERIFGVESIVSLVENINVFHIFFSPLAVHIIFNDITNTIKDKAMIRLVLFKGTCLQGTHTKSERRDRSNKNKEDL